MPYSVQFVGLACFFREQGARNVLLPDGRTPPAGVEPHFASIVVASGAIDGSTGWDGDADAAGGVFRLPPCSVLMTGADCDGPLDTQQQEPFLPHLRQLAPDFEIDPAYAETIARVPIRCGVLTAYCIPGGDAVISQLDVPHDDAIVVVVKPDDGSPERTISLKPSTEIVIANVARGGYAAAEAENGHFRIYEKLSVRPVSLLEPEVRPDIPPSPSRHVLFTRNAAIGLSMHCSNTGCC
jgi:hypothetical protein